MNKLYNQIKAQAMMEEGYVYDAFEKRKCDFTSALHIRR